MKYLKTFENFSLILEAELKHSEILASKLEELFKKSSQELDDLGNFDAGTGEKINKAKYVEKFFESLKVEVSDVIYPKFKIQIGAIILQKGSELSYKYLPLFRKKSERTFIDDVKDCIVQNKLTDNFTEYLKKCFVKVNYQPYYEDPINDRLRFGSLVKELNVTKAFDSKESMFKCGIKLNLSNNETIRDEIKDTIRHELQHLTQLTNTLCLNVAEFFIKNIDSIHNIRFLDEISKIYEDSVKKIKVGSGKTLTGLKQSGDGEMFDAETGKETSLKSAFEKVYKKDSKDVGLTKDEQELAKELEYLGDDVEYKPWMSDKASYWYKLLLEIEEKNGKKVGDIEDRLRLVVPYAFEKDKELNLLNKLRKETSGEFYRYMRKKIEKESA